MPEFPETTIDYRLPGAVACSGVVSEARRRAGRGAGPELGPAVVCSGVVSELRQRSGRGGGLELGPAELCHCAKDLIGAVHAFGTAPSRRSVALFPAGLLTGRPPPPDTTPQPAD